MFCFLSSRGRSTSICLLCILFPQSGCGGIKTDYSKLDLCRVSGKIKLDGQPLVGAIVKFEAPDSTFAIAQTNSAGRYTLMLNSEKKGVIPGPKVVRISTLGSLGEEDGAGESEEEEPPKVERVPAAYNKDSRLRVTVERSQSFDFNLQSDGSTTGPIE